MNEKTASGGGLREGQDAGAPEQLRMISAIGGTTFPLVVKAALETGVFGALSDRVRKIGEMAAELALDEESLRRLCRALAVIGIVSLEDEDSVRVTRFGSTLLPDRPHSVAPLASYLLADSTLRPMMELGYSVRTGKPALRQDEDQGWYAGNPERSRLMDGAMEVYSSLTLGSIVDAYPFGDFPCIVDIAGGLGHMLAGLLKKFPSSRGVLLELPPTAVRAAAYLEAIGLSNRCRIDAGSMFEAVPREGDLYLLSKTLNNWDDEHAVTVLRNIRSVMKPNARLLLVEMLRKEQDPTYEEVVRDLIFLTCSNGGRTRTLDELTALVAAAGLTLDRVIDVPGAYPLLECVKA